MRLSIVIPTYKRPDDLPRLLHSLSVQTEQPHEILVVVGPGDGQGLATARAWQAKCAIIQVLEARRPSVIHALNLAFSVAAGEVICLLDDDVWLPADWARKVRTAYQANAKIGAYGGRDHLQLDNPRLANPPLAPLVGTYRWDGGLVGNHHCGVLNSPVRVDVVKGCNLSFRRAALAELQIDPALEAEGAEVCWEADICQRVRLAGFDVVYENNNYVLHYASPRPAADNRNDLFTLAQSQRMFNEALVVAKFRPSWEVVSFCLRSFLLGSRAQPGLFLAFFLISKHGWSVLKLPWRHAGFMGRGISQGLQRRQTVTAL